MMHKVSHIKKALLFLRIISVIFLKIYWGTTVMSRTTEMLTKGVEKKKHKPPKACSYWVYKTDINTCTSKYIYSESDSSLSVE